MVYLITFLAGAAVASIAWYMWYSYDNRTTNYNKKK